MGEALIVRKGGGKKSGQYVWKKLTTEGGDFIDFVVSDQGTAYPDGGTQGGYWYQKIYSTTIDGVEITEPLNLTKIISYANTSVSTLPYEFQGGSAVIYKGEIHILGGAVNNLGITKHYKWGGSSWVEASTLPYGFCSGCAVVYNDEIHIMGGTDNTSKHYKWDGVSWTEVSTIPYVYFNNGSAVVYNDEIHIMGGNYRSTQHYKWDGNSWTEVSTLPCYFLGGSAVVYKNEIHILGAYETQTISGVTTDLYRIHYKWDGNSWTEVSTLPYNFYFGCAVIYNNEIHIMGTENSANSSNLRKHYKWNGTSWTGLTNLPYNFYHGCAVIYNNEIHILGGKVTNYKTCHYNLIGEITYKKAV